MQIITGLKNSKIFHISRKEFSLHLKERKKNIGTEVDHSYSKQSVMKPGYATRRKVVFCSGGGFLSVKEWFQ